MDNARSEREILRRWSRGEIRNESVQWPPRRGTFGPVAFIADPPEELAREQAERQRAMLAVLAARIEAASLSTPSPGDPNERTHEINPT